MTSVALPSRSDTLPSPVGRPAIDWLQPVSALAPCGPSLEYDHEYAVLLSRMTPQADAQYGSFVDSPEVPNWAEVERDCQRLLLRTKDINLLVWLCRARTRLGQAAGLAHALGMLRDLLEAWPDEVHPQLLIEGEAEPAVRANALAGLVDPEGLLADVCEIAVVTNTAMRLTVRDVERAFAVPRMSEAATPESVTQQLAALRATAPGQMSPLDWLEAAAGHVHAIDAWARVQLGDEAPALTPLSRVLDLFLNPSDRHAAAAKPKTEAIIETPLPVPSTEHAAPSRRQAITRDDVLASIRNAREWFEHHEPSSPVAVLLKQAERMVGKRFSQVADSIPFDLLRKWECADDGDEVHA
jgi:type VI secretion system protein ImpA